MLTYSLPGGVLIDVVGDPSGNESIRIGATVEGSLVRPPTPRARVGETAFYIPYTKVWEATAEAAPEDAVWVDVSASPDAYFGALYAIWDRAESFALIEHDIICRPDVVEAFESCPEPWCVFGYDDICCPGCMEAWRNELGCTRFREELMLAVPDAVSAIPRDGWDWHNLCDGLGNRLRAEGFTHHWHYPAVGHFHHGQKVAAACD